MNDHNPNFKVCSCGAMYFPETGTRTRCSNDIAHLFERPKEQVGEVI